MQIWDENPAYLFANSNFVVKDKANMLVENRRGNLVVVPKTRELALNALKEGKKILYSSESNANFFKAWGYAISSVYMYGDFVFKTETIATMPGRKYKEERSMNRRYQQMVVARDYDDLDQAALLAMDQRWRDQITKEYGDKGFDPQLDRQSHILEPIKMRFELGITVRVYLIEDKIVGYFIGGVMPDKKSWYSLYRKTDHRYGGLSDYVLWETANLPQFKDIEYELDGGVASGGESLARYKKKYAFATYKVYEIKPKK